MKRCFFSYANLCCASQVRESLGRPDDTGPHTSVTVACFLIQEGADILQQNKKGHTPLQTCTPEVVSMVTRFKDSLPLKGLGSNCVQVYADF